PIVIIDSIISGIFGKDSWAGRLTSAMRSRFDNIWGGKSFLGLIGSVFEEAFDDFSNGRILEGILDLAMLSIDELLEGIVLGVIDAFDISKDNWIVKALERGGVSELFATMLRAIWDGIFGSGDSAEADMMSAVD